MERRFTCQMSAIMTHIHQERSRAATIFNIQQCNLPHENDALCIRMVRSKQESLLLSPHDNSVTHDGQLPRHCAPANILPEFANKPAHIAAHHHDEIYSNPGVEPIPSIWRIKYQIPQIAPQSSICTLHPHEFLAATLKFKERIVSQKQHIAQTSSCTKPRLLSTF